MNNCITCKFLLLDPRKDWSPGHGKCFRFPEWKELSGMQQPEYHYCAEYKKASENSNESS